MLVHGLVRRIIAASVLSLAAVVLLQGASTRVRSIPSLKSEAEQMEAEIKLKLSERHGQI